MMFAPEDNEPPTEPHGHYQCLLLRTLPTDVVACIVAAMPADTMKAFALSCRAASRAVASEKHWHLRFKVV